MPRKDKDTEKPSKPVLEEPPEMGNVESNVPSGDIRPRKGIDRSKISPKALKMAKELGVDLNPILDWAEGVDLRFQALQESLEPAVQHAIERTLTALQQKAQENEQEARRRYIEQGGAPPGRSGGGSGMESMLIQGLLGGGGGMDEEMMKLQREMMRASIDSVKADIGFTHAIKGAFVQKLTGKVIGDSLKSVGE